MNKDPNFQIWQRTRILSQPFWAFYERMIGTTNLHPSSNSSDTNNSNLKQAIFDKRQTDFSYSDSSHLSEDVEDQCEDEVSPEYLEFIKITRAHQVERERQKQLELKQKPKSDFEEYYKDISLVNTLVEDNLVEAPSKDNKGQLSKLRQREEELIKLYGSREAYERIRSIEMSIDENFSKKCQELSPGFWPVMPLNPKPYLNQICDGR